MGFFNFFKRDISEEEFQEQQKVKRGLEKTRTGFFQRIVNTLTNAQIDDDLYDQLEEQLILADVGPACAVRLVDELHDEVEEKHLKTGQEALDALRGIICQELTPRYPMELDGKPAVILVIGVGEKIDDLMEFDAQTFVESLLPESALQKDEKKEEGESEA